MIPDILAHRFLGLLLLRLFLGRFCCWGALGDKFQALRQAPDGFGNVLTVAAPHVGCAAGKPRTTTIAAHIECASPPPSMFDHFLSTANTLDTLPNQGCEVPNRFSILASAAMIPFASWESKTVVHFIIPGFVGISGSVVTNCQIFTCWSSWRRNPIGPRMPELALVRPGLRTFCNSSGP